MEWLIIIGVIFVVCLIVGIINDNNKYMNRNNKTPHNYSLSRETIDLFNFEDEHKKELQKWDNKLWKAESNISYGEGITNPETIEKQYQKAIDLYEEFKYFCDSNIGGDSYFEEEIQSRYDDLLEGYEEFMENEYEDLMIAYKEFTEKRKQINKLRKEVKQRVIEYKSISQVDLLKLYDENMKNDILKILNELSQLNEVKKYKEGSRVYFKLND
ncbi:MAG: hypothetical protein FWD48_01010 [Oscillospiraceae bacterium]|nr:hypothetical protein [Oscillospiraceae bacterium]